MTDRISIRGIEVLAKHGVLEEEQEKAQMFRVDLDIYADLSKAGETDNLADTVDYSSIALEVREVVGSESHKLIERVAKRVADAILDRQDVSRAIVTIHKPNAPIDLVFDDVSVTVDRTR